MKHMVWINRRNRNKFLDVVRYGCGHYYVAQYMWWMTEYGEVKNYIGGRRNRRRRQRWTKKNLNELLRDYEEVTA